MADKILLLPDNIANQIAAGEVIQRPASAVKELLENAIDAGATEIKLIVQDAGKSLVKVVDNGVGMSETDARMCFERHATSKIQKIDDLFHIKTMGFRGEALASIAAVAQVELKTKKAENDAGTVIEIENSKVTHQGITAIPTGTSIAMKNLFFNVPARRNFLKSNNVEMRHIIDEFTRVVLAWPQIFFSLTSNNNEIFHLELGSLKQRIIQVLGAHYDAKMVAVKDNTSYLNVSGFIGKPETAKKTRGDQYFFVNNRYIKSPYLNHAVTGAYQNMIPADNFPMYVIFIEIDPELIDVNVHPTKQEIKFEDEKIVYAFIQASVKYSLAQYNIMPSLDFDLDAEIQKLPSIQQPFTEEKKAQVVAGDLFKGFSRQHQAHVIEPAQKQQLPDWENFYAPVSSSENDLNNPETPPQTTFVNEQNNFSLLDIATVENAKVHQVLNRYLVFPLQQSILIFHQQSVHERVLYEKFLKASEAAPIASQQTLFPITIELAPNDAVLLLDLVDILQYLGYNIQQFGKNTFVLHGTPADIKTDDEKSSIELLLEQFKHFKTSLQISKRERLIRSLARRQSVKSGTELEPSEITHLLSELLQCEQKNISPDGFPLYMEIKSSQLEKMFGKEG